MAQKATKQVPPRTLSDQEKQAQIIRFLQQKREQFTLMILPGLCTNLKVLDDAGMEVVDLAVKMADHLMEKLYPIKEEESK